MGSKECPKVATSEAAGFPVKVEVSIQSYHPLVTDASHHHRHHHHHPHGHQADHSHPAHRSPPAEDASAARHTTRGVATPAPAPEAVLPMELEHHLKRK